MVRLCGRSSIGRVGAVTPDGCWFDPSRSHLHVFAHWLTSLSTCYFGKWRCYAYNGATALLLHVQKANTSWFNRRIIPVCRAHISFVCPFLHHMLQQSYEHVDQKGLGRPKGRVEGGDQYLRDWLRHG